MRKHTIVLIIMAFIIIISGCSEGNKTTEETNGFELQGSSAIKQTSTETSSKETLESTESDTEEVLRRKFQDMKSSGKSVDIQDFVQSLDGVDWSELFTQNLDEGFSIMNWFADQAKSGNEQALEALMINRKGLDGAFAEYYSWQMGDILELKTDMFIKTLSGLEDSDIEDILEYTNYEIKGKKEISQKLDALLHSNSLNDKEELIVKNLIGLK